MAEIMVNGKGVHYTTGGKAWETGLPLVVFVHGAGGNQSIWVMQSRALAHHGWNVASVDLPGHGRSEDQYADLCSAHKEDAQHLAAQYLNDLCGRDHQPR